MASRTVTRLAASAAIISTGAIPVIAAVPAHAAPALAPAAIPANAKTVQTVIDYAKSKISPAEYLWGGEGPVRFDCSGLTMMAWRQVGVNIPHNSLEQLNFSPHVTRANIKPGDLVVYSFSEFADHVALYVGPIGPGGADLIDTASRHPGGGVNWSSMATRGGSVAGIVRPADLPLGGAGGGTAAPPPADPPPSGGTTTPPPSGGVTWGHHRHSGGATAPAGSTYTVKAGDTLSRIADALGIDSWETLWAANKPTVPDANLIYPGQRLTVPTASAPPVSWTGSPAPSQGSADVPAAGDYVRPVSGAVGTPYHQQGSAWALGYHTGVDFLASSGSPVSAVADGTVVAAGFNGAYGNEVVIRHADGKYSQYAHLSFIAITKGASVTAGQNIGKVGATGNASGPHLHFEIRTGPGFGSDIDPLAYLRAHGVSV